MSNTEITIESALSTVPGMAPALVEALCNPMVHEILVAKYHMDINHNRQVIQSLPFGIRSMTVGVFRYAIEMGIRQSCADAGAGIKSAENTLAATTAQFDRLMSGDVPATGGSGKTQAETDTYAAARKSVDKKNANGSKRSAADIDSATLELLRDFPEHFAEAAAEIGKARGEKIARDSANAKRLGDLKAKVAAAMAATEADD